MIDVTANKRGGGQETSTAVLTTHGNSFSRAVMRHFILGSLCVWIQNAERIECIYVLGFQIFGSGLRGSAWHVLLHSYIGGKRRCCCASAPCSSW